jgi:hypothetical protein
VAKAKADAYGITASAADQGVNAVDEAGWSQALDKVVESIGILVCNAANGFGFAPRDAYDGNFCLYSAKVGHNDNKLLNTVNKFSRERSLTGSSHRIFAVYP